MKINVVLDDITESDADAIVNAANTSLLGGGGVDGAIHRAAGPGLLEECKQVRDRQGGCPVGEAVITYAGELLALYVIHTVGPTWVDGKHNEAELLERCYINCLTVADQHDVETLAFPNISTGAYGFPKELAAGIAVNAVKNYQSTSVAEVTFVCFEQDNYELYQKLFTG